MNIELLRKTQQSILNEANPFDMRSYCLCICAHAIAAATGRSLPLIDFPIHMAFEHGMRVLEIDYNTADGLFSAPYARIDRQYAAGRIQALIDTVEKGLVKVEGSRHKQALMRIEERIAEEVLV